MFRINSKEMKSAVEAIMKSARRAKLKDTIIDVQSIENGIVFKFAGSELYVSHTANAEVDSDIFFSTTVFELNLKVSSLPDGEVITVMEKENKIFLKWGRNSLIRVERVDSQCKEIDFISKSEKLNWSYATIQNITRNIPSFTAVPGSNLLKKIPTLAGIFLQKDGEKVQLHATNSNKAISMVETDISWFEESATIPAEAWFAMYELFSIDSLITVSNNGSSLVRFESEQTVIISRLINGEFPNVSALYVQDGQASTTWRVDRLELLEGTRRARHLMDRSSLIEFQCDGKKTFLILKDQLQQQIGAMVEGNTKRFQVNAEDLELILSILRTEDVIFLYNNGKSMTIRGDEEETKISCMLGVITQ